MTDVPIEVRTSILNVDTGKGIYLQYEPVLLSGNIGANYNPDPAISGTHENQTFAHTGNENFELEMRWNRIHLSASTGKPTDECDRILREARAFVRSLVSPSRLVLDVVGGDPPLTYLSCPGVYAVYAKLRNIEWDVPRRDPKNGAPLEMTLRCTFFEDPQYRYYAEEIVDVGYDRS